jgi:hypothetical protein
MVGKSIDKFDSNQINNLFSTAYLSAPENLGVLFCENGSGTACSSSTPCVNAATAAAIATQRRLTRFRRTLSADQLRDFETINRSHPPPQQPSSMDDNLFDKFLDSFDFSFGDDDDLCRTNSLDLLGDFSDPTTQPIPATTPATTPAATPGAAIITDDRMIPLDDIGGSPTVSF